MNIEELKNKIKLKAFEIDEKTGKKRNTKFQQEIDKLKEIRKNEIFEKKVEAEKKIYIPRTKKTETKQEVKPEIKQEVKPEIKPEIKEEVKPEIKEIKPTYYYRSSIKNRYDPFSF